MKYLTYLLLVSLSVCFCKSRVLILTDTTNSLNSFSKLFPANEYIVESKVFSEIIPLVSYGELQYENLVLCISKLKKVTYHAAYLIDYLNYKGNIMLVMEEGASEHLKLFAKEFGIRFEDSDKIVTDYSNETDPYVVSSNNYSRNAKLIFENYSKPVFFKGTGHLISSNNPLVFPLISSHISTFSGEPDALLNIKTISGKKLKLVSAVQARNNARVTFVGSKYFLNDERNKPVVQKLIDWNFQKSFVLSVEKVSHSKVNETEKKEWYRIKDDINYSIEIKELKNGVYVPFKNSKDVQLELTMLDPYYRVTLSDNNDGIYSVKSLTIPDVYGIYTFRVRFQKLGYSFFHEQERIVIKPFRHNEYERFIVAAYPYYTNVFSNMIAFFALVLVLLHGDQKQEKLKSN